MHTLPQVIGIELLAQTLLPAVEDLATDKHWRVRQAIIEHTPMLATQVDLAACSLAGLSSVQRQHVCACPRGSQQKIVPCLWFVTASPSCFAAGSGPFPAEAGEAVHAVAAGK